MARQEGNAKSGKWDAARPAAPVAFRALMALSAAANNAQDDDFRRRVRTALEWGGPEATTRIAKRLGLKGPQMLRRYRLVGGTQPPPGFYEIVSDECRVPIGFLHGTDPRIDAGAIRSEEAHILTLLAEAQQRIGAAANAIPRLP